MYMYIYIWIHVYECLCNICTDSDIWVVWIANHFRDAHQQSYNEHIKRRSPMKKERVLFLWPLWYFLCTPGRTKHCIPRKIPQEGHRVFAFSTESGHYLLVPFLSTVDHHQLPSGSYQNPNQLKKDIPWPIMDDDNRTDHGMSSGHKIPKSHSISHKIHVW